MKPIISGCVVVAALIATGLVQDIGGVVNTAAAQALQKTSREVPKFEVDPDVAEAAGEVGIWPGIKRVRR